ncbi:hypothetical protein K6H11_004257 [Candida tropicalis]
MTTSILSNSSSNPADYKSTTTLVQQSTPSASASASEDVPPLVTTYEGSANSLSSGSTMTLAVLFFALVTVFTN